MLSWILTSTVIGVLSAAALELFRETDEFPADRPRSSDWETMTEGELEALLDEFSRAADRQPQPSPALAA
jgi:hypothetical protein